MPKPTDEFKYFDVGDPNPIGKYKQPKPSDHKPGGGGYPEEGIDNVGVMVKGRWPAGTKKKVRKEMRGYGAAERGRKFYEDD